MLTLSILCAALAAAEPPVITVSADDTRIDRSCIIRIDPDVVIEDANGDGVIHIVADGITVEFEEGSQLRGAPADRSPDTFAGVGVRIDGHRDVTVRGARVSGYRVGIRATGVPGLTVEHADLSGNYRQRLKSTAAAEDGSDWLWPHRNDDDEWTRNYGAALSIRNAENITLRDITVRRGQNGIILDRVDESRIYDNDCSFLSGWGLAMWRSSRNTITRNALDFCVRGYSHGVYNRGQDSAGLLMFEQCNDNIIAQNSITHGGDGIFGFAGREAIGEQASPTGEYPGGNRGNIIVMNDLSYAPAHGLEMTFSHDNVIMDNRFAGNAICGIWGGYSNGFLIANNIFENNGEMAYGLERGGINMEHASGNRIIANRFRGNACGVHLWWDDDGDLLRRPGVVAHYRGVSENIIAGNLFERDRLAVHLRDLSPASDRVRGTVVAANGMNEVEEEIRAEPPTIEIIREGTVPPIERPDVRILGEKEPVGSRRHLRGRENIIMTEWGPWDHQSPMARLRERSGRRHVYELYHIDREQVRVEAGDGLSQAASHDEGRHTQWMLTLEAAEPGVYDYSLVIGAPGHEQTIEGSIIHTSWDLVVFPWHGDGGPNPPRDLDQWRTLADSAGAVRASVDQLSFRFGGRGPSQLRISPEITAADFKADHFGIIARTRLPLDAGAWRIRTLSDDGVRVMVDGETVIENWTHHGATVDTGEFTLDQPREVEMVVEYFEIYGAAVLDVQIERAR
jgi:parallel beta-helix repeat protein